VADIRDVARAMKLILESHRPQMTMALNRAGMSSTMGTILEYWTDAIDSGMYPLLMIQHESDDTAWIALPDIAEETYNLTVWGFILHEDPRIRSDAVGMLAGVVKDAFNRNHYPIDLGNGTEMYFNDVCPIKHVEYGVSQLNSTIAHGFVATFTSNALIQERDERS